MHILLHLRMDRGATFYIYKVPESRVKLFNDLPLSETKVTVVWPHIACIILNKIYYNKIMFKKDTNQTFKMYGHYLCLLYSLFK